MALVKQTCDRCDGSGGYYPCPEYQPFRFSTCSKCGGKGIILVEGKPKTKKQEFKDMVKRNPDKF